MKKVGKEVLFLKTDDANPRNGESTFARISDGTIMFAYTEYYGEDWIDHACARISAYFSYDNGETFTDKKVLLEKDGEAKNYMSPSLFRLADGTLGMVFLRKSVNMGKLLCMPMFTKSSDEGKTWSKLISCFEEEAYYCVVNDSVTVTSDGEILVPAAYYSEVPTGKDDAPGKIRIASSKNNGESFELIPKEIVSPYEDRIGLQEPGIYQYKSGDFLIYCRTAYGYQYEAELSKDKSKVSAVIPNFNFTSPDSPMRIKKVGKYTVAVFNPVSYNCLSEKGEFWHSPKRSPLVVAVSENDGKSFSSKGKTFAHGELAEFSKSLYFIEDDLEESYCYPAICDTDDGFLVTYYHSNKSGICLNSSKIKKIYYEEIEK